jgi:hypothetical protein
VEEKGYSPPRWNRILEWRSTQDFHICPNPDDPDACNIYSELEFPDEVYESIQEYQEKDIPPTLRFSAFLPTRDSSGRAGLIRT